MHKKSLWKFISKIIFLSYLTFLPIHANQSRYITPRYRLGPGDKLSMKIYKVDGFTTNFQVLPDGTINLPRVGLIPVNDLTIQEAKSLIEKKYKNIIKNPIVYLDLISTKSIRITITGEVNSPGIYTLSNSENSNLSNLDGGETSMISYKGWPTVVEAVQRAGGIKQNADLRNLVLKRYSHELKSDEEIKINLWEAIKDGNPNQNPLIYDRDTIHIPIAKSLSNEEAQIISSSNISPSTITVNVIGEVKNPGPQKLISNSPLSSSIFSAGGLKSDRSNPNSINLFRINLDGSINRRVISFNPYSDVNDKNNPALRDGDIVLIKRNKWTKNNDRLRNFVRPISPILNAATVYKLFGD